MHREFVSRLDIRPTPLKYAARVRCVLLDEWHKEAFKQRKTNKLTAITCVNVQSRSWNTR